MRILSIFGTRPEAIKMAPLVKALANEATVSSLVCVTGQHRTMLDQVLENFGIRADFDLNVMAPDQTLNGVSTKILAALDAVMEEVKPDRILVHGDTTTAMAASVAAFHRRVPVGHVEAGLRTRDISRPWPEEMNRRVVDVVSDLLFAPTQGSKKNLESESLNGRIVVTGNTVIDALYFTMKRIDHDAALKAKLDAQFSWLRGGRRVILVTGHRRESFGAGFQSICMALKLLGQREDAEIVYPVHLNPNVRGPVMAALKDEPAIHLIAPLDYVPFVYLMRRSYVVLTDSGGVQEEAPALGKPVLVMRDVTERPEAVRAGTVKLVGANLEGIVSACSKLLDDDQLYRSYARRLNPYGDGRACERIAAVLTGRSLQEFGMTPSIGRTWPRTRQPLQEAEASPAVTPINGAISDLHDLR